MREAFEAWVNAWARTEESHSREAQNDKMWITWQAAYKQALEDAAKVCDQQIKQWEDGETDTMERPTADDCATSIRTLVK